jgi:Xaa-Pro aminopeptidase
MSGHLVEVPSMPVAADFAAPPGTADRRRWAEADLAARPGRRERVRARLAAEGLDAYFGLRPEHIRYLTGFVLGDGEEKVAGVSGHFLIGMDECVVFADSRYTMQAAREAPDCRVEIVYGDLPERWPALVASVGARRIGVEADVLTHAVWERLTAAAPDVELVPVSGWVEADRAIKAPDELERVAAACAAADRALARLLPEIRPGVTEADLALRLEWLIRTGGADGLAFDVACLAGPEAALPHGSPGERPVRSGAVLLFDFGARVDGYRSDMTRTLFVGEPSPRDLELYAIVARAQAAGIEAASAPVRAEGSLPSGQAIDAAARGVIEAAGFGERFGHGTGHGIGLAVHELPNAGRRAPDIPIPSPTVFSVEPGIYLDGETGVRIEDLLAIDAAARDARILTRFPKDLIVLR